MDFKVDLPTLDNENRKLDRIRKNILYDVLTYNMEASNSKRQQKKIQQQHDQLMFDEMLTKEQIIMRREDEEKRQLAAQQRRMLQQEYDREIQYKRERERQERLNDSIYARMETENQIYRNERRMYDLERIYNRRGYNAKLVGESSRYDRIKTEPNYNPEERNEYSGRKERPKDESKSANKYPERQMRFEQPHYNDSLDDLKIKDSVGSPAYAMNKQYEISASGQNQNQYQNRRVSFQ